MKDFRDLKVWQAAHELTLMTYRDTAPFPKEELYGLTSQIRRAAASVAANIAEGRGRETTKDYVHFLIIARGSLKETLSHCALAKALGYINETKADQLFYRYRGLDRAIFACLTKTKEKAV